MERISPIPPPIAVLAAGKVIPLGQGWVLEPLETGFLLKSLAQAVQVQVTPEEAQSLRQGDVTAEEMAARAGAAPPQALPGAAITVAFSDEALRIAGKDRARSTGSQGVAPQHQGTGAGPTLPGATKIGAVVIALLLLALIWAI
ncbi:hypothetical protein [Paragemmobacter ruber]|uniref:Uncharacterized protein n=1 Tax=Paragemmobacter ruber TaxID=1985673 RepID=A0ABW9Y335_9RHOB|nr:hypothetical protein [Rhodobacter ruber]NBE06644.1 hypothetical protein [Rhodobacter ruber]